MMNSIAPCLFSVSIKNKRKKERLVLTTLLVKYRQESSLLYHIWPHDQYLLKLWTNERLWMDNKTKIFQIPQQKLPNV